MPDTFAITIIFIVLSAGIAAFFRGRSRDKCLKDFSDYVITEEKTGGIIEKYKKMGATSIVFGDLFLEDIKKYRDACLERWKFSGIYPIWLRQTRQLADEMIQEGFRTLVTCVDTTQIDKSFAGREFDKDFLKDLPASADPCGEKGEFHTFVYDAPYFSGKVNFLKNDFFIKDDRFYYCDLQINSQSKALLNNSNATSD